MSGRIRQWFPLPVGEGPVSCGVCGCRLTEDAAAGGWRHFPSPYDGQDARGCRPACLDRLHDRAGRALTDLVPA